MKMTRATQVYFVLAVIFAFALWLALALGSRYLVAQPDINGQWQMDGGESGREFTIEQSGKYLHLTWGQSHLDLKITSVDAGNITLAGEGWTVVATRRDDGTNFQFHAPPGAPEIASGVYQLKEPEENPEAAATRAAPGDHAHN